MIGFPHVRAATAETKGSKSHRLEGNVACEDHQVGPGDPAAILLLDRPEQAPRLLEVHIIRPAVERRIALLTPAAAAATVAGAIGTGAVPRHSDEQRTVVTEVRRPPVLRVSHERREVFFQRREVEALELPGIVEIRVHRVGLRGMLVQQVERQVVRPPIFVRRAAAQRVIERTLCASRVAHVKAPAQKGWLQYIPALGMALSLLSIVAIDGTDGHSDRVPAPVTASPPSWPGARSARLRL